MSDAAHDAPLAPDALRQALARTRLLALDVDGVLTDGAVVYEEADDGAVVETQRFDVRDGLGLNLLREAGVTVAWITGRGCEATRRRAAELGVAELHERARDGKGAVLDALQQRLGVAVEETVAMGDDLPDLALGRRAAVLAAPGDAHPSLRARAALVTSALGGRGAVRELCDRILEAKGLAEGLVRRFGG